MLLKSQISTAVNLVQMNFFTLSEASRPSPSLDFSSPPEHSLNQSSNVWCAEMASGAESEIIAVMFVLAKCSFS